MNKDETNEKATEHQQKIENRFEKCKKWLKHFLGENLWNDIRAETRHVKFWLELVGATILLIYTFIAGLQWRSTLRVMRADQRAWIVPINSGIYLKDGEVISQNFIYKNIGKTPAKHIRVDLAMEEIGWNDGPHFDYLTSSHDANAVYPENGNSLGVAILASAPGTSTPQPVKYTDDIKTKFMNQKVVFVLHGRLTYTDIFGTSHWINYCGIARGTPTKSGMINDSTAAQKCEEYSDTDAE